MGGKVERYLIFLLCVFFYSLFQRTERPAKGIHSVLSGCRRDEAPWRPLELGAIYKEENVLLEAPECMLLKIITKQIEAISS